MVDCNVQQDVRSRMGAELRECVRQGHFLTRVVMDGVIVALEVKEDVLETGWHVCQVLLGGLVV